MARRSEADELVLLWQELQVAQVSGDLRRLERLRQRAEVESRNEDASEEWRLLADDAGRNLERLHGELAVQPSVGVGGDAVPVDLESTPEPVEGGGKRARTGTLIWLAILVGWVVLQIVQGFGDGNGSP